MPTGCNATQFAFEGLGSRRVTASFDGGAITSKPGAGWEKGQVENRIGDLREALFVPWPRPRRSQRLADR